MDRAGKPRHGRAGREAQLSGREGVNLFDRWGGEHGLKRSSKAGKPRTMWASRMFSSIRDFRTGDCFEQISAETWQRRGVCDV
jgi:hypothetical protein